MIASPTSRTAMDDVKFPRRKVPFFNLRIDVLDRGELLEELRPKLSVGGDFTSINFLNAHCFNIAQNHEEYRTAIGRCTYLLNDGVGVDIAGRLIGVHFKENLNGTDLIPDLFKL